MTAADSEKRASTVSPAKDLVSNATDWRRAQRFLIFLVSAAAVVILALFLYYSLLVPLAISALVAYLLLPLTNHLEKKGWSRAVSTASIIFLFLLVVGLGVARLVPVLYLQGQILVHLVPGTMRALLDHWLPVLDAAIIDLGFDLKKSLRDYVGEYNLFSTSKALFEQSLARLWNTGATLLGSIVNIALIPLVTFFLLKEHPNITRVMQSLVPIDLRQPVGVTVAKVDQTLRSVIKGQALVAAILTVMYVIGFSAVGLQSAVAIGVVAGLCRIVPYLDVIVGGMLSTIVLLSDFPGWATVFGVFMVFMVVQGLDGALITPRVIGERVGLHPLVVILSVLASAYWFGFWGILLAIPVVAIAKALIVAALPFYQASKLFRPVWFDDRKG